MVSIRAAEIRHSAAPFASLRLTRGNFWRFIGLLLLVLLTIWLIMLLIILPSLAMYSGYAGRVWAEAMPSHRPLTPADIKTIRNQIDVYQPLFWACYLLFYVFFTGFSVALVSYACKALKGYDAKEPIADA